MKVKILSLSLIIPLFWVFWSPGLRVSTDFHLTDKSVQIVNIFPWVWKETAVADGLGEYYALSLWSQPIHTFFAVLASINIPFEIQEKIFGLIIILLGFWGIWKLLDKFNINTLGKSIGSIFFLLNSYFLLIFDGGQLSLALAYCILPMVVYYFLKATEADFLKDKLKFALWVLILSIADIRIVYLVLLIILIFSLFKTFLGLKESLIFFRRLFVNGIFATIVLALFHMYWLMPTLISKQIQLPQTYERVSQISFLSFSTLAHSLLLQQPHWYKNIFGSLNALRAEFIFIPLIVFSVLVLIKKNAIAAFWLLVAVISIFLSKGANEPFGQVYSFLFSYIPGFSIFRDPSKFYFLICISYSVLIGFSLQAFCKLNFKNPFFNRLVKIAPFVFLIYLVWLARPVYLGQMNGLFSFPSFQREYNQLSDFLGKEESFSRVFWIPNTAPLGFVNILHPSVPADRFSQKRPFAAGTKGTYETFNFLRDAPYMGEVFDVSGIGYIAYPYIDSKREVGDFDKEKYYYTFLNQLLKLPWLSKVEYSGIPALKVKNHQDKFFSTQNIWWVIGDDSLYNESTKSAQLKLSDNGLIFAEEYAGLGQRIDEIPDAKIVLNNKSTTDLAASFIDPSNLTFPAESLGFDPDVTSGWWKREAVDLVWWRDFLQTKYGIDNKDFDLGGGWAVGEGKLEFRIKNLELSKDKILLARVMESSRSGELSFSQEGQLVGKINTKNEGGTNVRWFEVSQLNSDKELEIASEGDINVVNAVAVLDKNEWENFQQKAKKLEGRIVNFDQRNARSSNNTEVIYRKINPTKYIVDISGLTASSFLVFSQNYDPFWKMNDQSPLPVYSLLNGFKIEKDGQYIIEFEPQKYVYPGLIISGLTAVILILALVKSSRS